MNTVSIVKPLFNGVVNNYDEAYALDAYGEYLKSIPHINELVKLCNELNDLNRSQEKSNDKSNKMLNLMDDIADQYRSFLHSRYWMMHNLLNHYGFRGYNAIERDSFENEKNENVWLEDKINYFARKKLDHVVRFNQRFVWFVEHMKNTNQFPEFLKKVESYQFPEIDMTKFDSGLQKYIATHKT
jgi:hypothetical protein